MTWAKVLGCAFLAAVAALRCASFVSAIRKRTEALDRAKRFARFVADQIAFYETPYPEIVAKFAAAEGISEASFADPASPSPDIKKIGVSLASGLDVGDAARFLSFFDGVGAGFAEAELRLCDETRRYFEERLAAVKDDGERRKKAKIALSVFAVFSVCVLVW